MRRELAKVKKERDFLKEAALDSTGYCNTSFFVFTGVKKLSVFRERAEVKYRMVERCRDAYPIRMMCRPLGVSPSGYYDAVRRGPSAREEANAQLLKQIQALHAESDGVRGSPRITDELRYPRRDVQP